MFTTRNFRNFVKNRIQAELQNIENSNPEILTEMAQYFKIRYLATIISPDISRNIESGKICLKISYSRGPEIRPHHINNVGRLWAGWAATEESRSELL